MESMLWSIVVLILVSSFYIVKLLYQIIENQKNIMNRLEILEITVGSIVNQ